MFAIQLQAFESRKKNSLLVPIITEDNLDSYEAVISSLKRTICPQEHQAGGDNAHVTDFAQTWYKSWVC